MNSRPSRRLYRMMNLITGAVSLSGALACIFYLVSLEGRSAPPLLIFCLLLFICIPFLLAIPLRRQASTNAETRQQVLLEFIQRYISATHDPDELFKLILSLSQEFTDSPWGCLMLYDPEYNILAVKAQSGYEDRSLLFPADRGIIGRAIRQQTGILSNRAAEDPDFYDATGGKTGSQLSVPIIYHDRILGAITLESPKEDQYSQEDLEVVQNLADQTAIAFIRAQLNQDAEKRLQEQSILYLIGSRLVGAQTMPDVLAAVVQAFSAIFNSHMTGVYLWDRETENFELGDTMQRTEIIEAEIPTLPPAINRQQLEAAGGSLDEPVFISSIQKDLADVLQVCGRCRAVLFPLRVANQCAGLVLAHLPGAQSFSLPDAFQIPMAIAFQSASAIQSAQLFADVSHGSNRLRAVLDSVGEGLLMLNDEGKIPLASRQVEIFTGTPLEIFINSTITDLPPLVLAALGFTASELQELIDLLPMDEQHEPPPKHRYQFRDYHFLRFITPVWSADDIAYSWLVVIRDVTEEHNASVARELLTETLVHDLRSPISIIKSSLDLIELELEGETVDPFIHTSIDIAQRSTQRALNLISSLLDINQLEVGSLDLNLTPALLAGLIQETINDFTAQAAEHDIRLAAELPDDLPSVVVDRDLVLRVISNLIDNALKFAPEGSQVVVSVKSIEVGMVQISVADSGPGIPDEYRKKVFERFGQVPNQRSRRRGSGLGLTFCRLAVEAHGGSIWVEDESDTPGATLSFTLPIG